MDLLKMIAELQEERQRLDEAIEALERLSADNKGRRRSRSARGMKPTDQPSQIDEESPDAHPPKDRRVDYPYP